MIYQLTRYIDFECKQRLFNKRLHAYMGWLSQAMQVIISDAKLHLPVTIWQPAIHLSSMALVARMGRLYR